MDYLIIGGAGFIGSSLVPALGANKIVVFDNFSPVVHGAASIKAFTELGADFVVGDVTDRSSVDSFFEERGVPKSIVYLAAETGTGRSLENCSLNARVNTLGLATVLDSLTASRKLPERIVLSSTRAVYGEGPYQNESGMTVFPDQRSSQDLEAQRFEYEGLRPLAMDASAYTPKPINIYGSTKLSQEHMLQNWTSAFGVPLYVFRLQNVYGAGQSLTNPYTGVLIHFIKQSLASKSVQIFENGGITRDFVHVKDVTALLALAAQGNGAPGLYDCGSGERVELEHVAIELAKIGGSPLPTRCNSYRYGDVRHACAAIERTMHAFDWLPRIPLQDGLSELYRFVSAKLA